MATAAAMVHIPKGDPFVNLKGGSSWELAAVYFAVAVAVLLVGPGTISLDHLLFGRRRTGGPTPFEMRS